MEDGSYIVPSDPSDDIVRRVNSGNNYLGLLSSYRKKTVKTFAPSRYLYLSRPYIDFFREMIQLIIKLHRLERSFRGFSVSNLGIFRDGKIKNLKFIGLMVFRANKESRKMDFHSAAAAIRLIVPNVGSLPLLEDLVVRLEDADCLKQKSIILNHLALMSVKDQLSFIRNCKEKKPSTRDTYEAAYRSAIYDMGANRGWTTPFRTGRGPLHMIFHYKHSKYVDGRTHSRVEVNESLFRFCRNVIAHMKERLSRIRRVTDDFIVKSILSHFERQLLSFYVELHKNVAWRKFQ